MSPIIKRDHVTLTTAEQAPARPRRGHARAANLLSVDGQVRAIEVSCTCGEKLVVELDYEQAVQNQAPAAPTAPAVENDAPEELPS